MPVEHEREDEDLLRRLERGDERPLSELFARHLRALGRLKQMLEGIPGFLDVAVHAPYH
jgi:hypothetical protein